MRFFHWIFRRPNKPPSGMAAEEGHSPFLLGHVRFLETLENERMRADRTNTPFALVVFRFPPSKHRVCSLKRFVALLQDRLRATDRAGCFGVDGQDIGVLLWDTQIDGVRTFIKDLRERCSTERLPRYDVYQYPFDSPDDSDKNRDDSERHETSCFQSTDAAAEKPRIHAENLHDPLPQIKSLEPLFVRPLPWWKRGIDILGAGFGLIVLSPLLLLTAVLIKLTSRGPVLFRQQRDGLGGKPFTIYKFRTMYLDAEARKQALLSQSEQDGPAFKMTNDPRVTPLGRYLRKTCIDELPQLWNVLRGDMTLVGPRPLEPRETKQIRGWGRRRIEVTPGLTCIWQTEGKLRVSFQDWMRMDIRYLKRRTLQQDLKLIGRTIIDVILHRASV